MGILLEEMIKQVRVLENIFYKLSLYNLSVLYYIKIHTNCKMNKLLSSRAIGIFN